MRLCTTVVVSLGRNWIESNVLVAVMSVHSADNMLTC